MNFRPLLVGAAIAASVWLPGCASSSSSGGGTMSRIDSNRALYESWPLEVREAILDGRIEEGMTRDMVMVAKGKPSRVTTRAGRGGDEEVWTYGGGSDGGGSRPNISIGGSMGGVGMSGSPGGGGGGSSVPTLEVVFQNGVVVRSTP